MKLFFTVVALAGATKIHLTDELSVGGALFEVLRVQSQLDCDTIYGGAGKVFDQKSCTCQYA